MKTGATIVTSLMLLFVANAQSQTIIVPTLEHAPNFSNEDSWQDIPITTIKLRPSRPGVLTQVPEVSLKIGQYDDIIFIYARWQDNTESTLHKPFIWNQSEQKYKKGPQREDRLVFQFEISGDYTTQWDSGQEFTADTWHWKAARSQPLGLAHDKHLTASQQRRPRAYEMKTPSGKPIYISRLSDRGRALYNARRYSAKQADIMPKYILANTPPTGSIADIKSTAHWQNGEWHVKLWRKLDTGHDDDVQFIKGQKISAGIAIFDHSPDDDHVISPTLSFQF